MWDDCQLKTTAVNAPQAGFTFSPAVPRAGAPVAFTNTSLGSEPLTYLWEFGDGATSTLKNPTHTFTAAGNYTVRLTATNQGDWDTFEQVIVVHELPAADDLELVLSISPTPVFLFQEETITAQVTNTGAASIAGVTASGAVPAHVTVVSYSDECSLSGGVLTCDLGTIAAGQSKTAWVKVIFTATGSFTHSMLLSPVDEVATLNINVQAALYLPIVRR
jgi:PKD repeat protein